GQDKIISDKRGLEAQVRDLRNEVGRRDQFSAAVAQRVVGGRLADERVLFVAAPDASSDTIRQLEQAVVLAGGTPTGVLRLREDLLDPGKTAVVDDLVAQVAPAGLQLPDGTATDRAAVELAAALVAKTPATALSEEAAAKILGGFTGADLVQVQAPAGGGKAAGTAPATMAVVVTGGTNGKDLDDVAKARQRAVLTLSRAMDDRSKGVVMGGPRSSAEPGGLVQALRDEGDLLERVSSVDVADTDYGRVVVVLALNEQKSGGSGSYGEGPGSESAAPPPGQ
ncbi:MAG: copper transporter, partial [Mycobacteriales bacterium]